MTQPDDEREAAWRKHVDQIAPYPKTGLISDIDAENRGRIYEAGFNAGWDARPPTVTDKRPGFLELTAVIEKAFLSDPTVPDRWVTAAPVAAKAVAAALRRKPE